jgi:uncharacterized Zn-binding protein involved in type VI secretion
MATVSVNSPKTPATKGSNGTAAATIPNVCKMPGPPAPFVPTPLPNIGKTGISPTGYSTTVKIEGHPVAIRGASFGSTGDAASKATGGGLVSANTHGPTKFIGTGSLDVKIEGKNVHFLSDPLVNNCGPSGSPPNAATLAGLMQAALMAAVEKNPGNDSVCGAGKHIERVWFPDVPNDEVSVLVRIAKLEQVAEDAGDLYEVAAARHNHAAGTLDHGRQISRKLTKEELAAGHHPDSQKVWAICSVCGYRREIDHAEKDGKHIVEAKSGRKGKKSTPQRANNVAFAARPGYGVTYKAPQFTQSAETALNRLGLTVIRTGG